MKHSNFTPIMHVNVTIYRIFIIIVSLISSHLFHIEFNYFVYIIASLLSVHCLLLAV